MFTKKDIVTLLFILAMILWTIYNVLTYVSSVSDNDPLPEQDPVVKTFDVFTS